MKYFAAITCLFALSASTNADGLGGLVYAPGHASVDYYAYPSYAFEYAVRDPHTGDNKAQWEKRDGDVVRGAYSLVEPDGSLRVVEYRADDKSGFNAVVKRIGPNLHPVAAPIYKAPLPVLGYKSELPISIGPVAGIEKLASAPLLNGPYLGGATSSAFLYKNPVPAIIKEVAPIAPLIPSPILPYPIIKEPIIKEPIFREPIIIKEPIIKEPIYREPIIIKEPIIKEPIYREPILIKEPIIKEPIIKVPYIKEPIYPAPLPYELPYLNAPLLKKAPLIEPIYPVPLLKAPLKPYEHYPNIDLTLLGKGLLNEKLYLNYKDIGLGYKGGYGH